LSHAKGDYFLIAVQNLLVRRVYHKLKVDAWGTSQRYGLDVFDHLLQKDILEHLIVKIKYVSDSSDPRPDAYLFNDLVSPTSYTFGRIQNNSAGETEISAENLTALVSSMTARVLVWRVFGVQNMPTVTLRDR
jgi:hypothetical protein